MFYINRCKIGVFYTWCIFMGAGRSGTERFPSRVNIHLRNFAGWSGIQCESQSWERNKILHCFVGVGQDLAEVGLSNPSRADLYRRPLPQAYTASSPTGLSVKPSDSLTPDGSAAKINTHPSLLDLIPRSPDSLLSDLQSNISHSEFVQMLPLWRDSLITLL